MSGRYTRKNYDNCAYAQQTKQSTDPLELILDVNKYVNANNMGQPVGEYPKNTAQLVDIESALMGRDHLSSKCDTFKHPFCAENGCLLSSDPRIGPHVTPYASNWGHDNETAVITTNMRMPTGPGYNITNNPGYNMQKNSNYGYAGR